MSMREKLSTKNVALSFICTACDALPGLSSLISLVSMFARYRCGKYGSSPASRADRREIERARLLVDGDDAGATNSPDVICRIVLPLASCR